MPVSAPSDKRFRRSHVRPAQRSYWRRRWVTLLTWSSMVIVTLTIAGTVAAQALNAKSLAISRISVTGNKRMSTHEVQQVLHELRGTNMLTADLESARNKLLESPWIGDVEIRRSFPSGISVAVVEREVAAIGRVGADPFLIDRRGEIIVRLDASHAGLDLPIVNGLQAAGGDGSRVDERRALLVGRLLAALQTRPDLAVRISEIDVSNPRDAVVLFDGETTLVRLGTEHFVERLQLYVDAAPALHDQVPAIDHVDMRYGERVFVKSGLAKQ